MSQSEIHPQAVVHATARLAEGVSIGPFAVIGPEVVLGAGVRVGPSVVIEKGTVIGERCRIFHGASLGGEPQVLGFDPQLPSFLEIGPDTVIREFVTIHRSMKENGVTRVGAHCLLMAYSHVGHDCEIGDHAVIVNQTGLSGHVVVQPYAFVSGMVGVHQHVRIGCHAMVGGFTALRKDVLPYSLVEGVPPRLISTNAVGLRRRNFPPQVRSALKAALKVIQDPRTNTRQALERIQSEIENLEEIRYLVDFIKQSTRGFIKGV